MNNFSETQKNSIFSKTLPTVFFRYLIEKWDGECFINVCNNLGKTALHEAAQNCFHQTVQYLLQHGMSYLLWGHFWSRNFHYINVIYCNYKFYSYILQWDWAGFLRGSLILRQFGTHLFQILGTGTEVLPSPCRPMLGWCLETGHNSCIFHHF